MIRPLRLIVALACLVAGIVVGALNPQRAVLDLGFTQVPIALGVLVLLALLIGVVLGGLALSASVVLPLRQRLRRAELDARNARKPMTIPEACQLILQASAIGSHEAVYTLDMSQIFTGVPLPLSVPRHSKSL